MPILSAYIRILICCVFDAHFKVKSWVEDASELTTQENQRTLQQEFRTRKAASSGEVQ